ncbi:MAG: integration host factor subunit beta [Fibrobacter sp.]|nr:integration host factor subunit beta [Fibrobacter sp.]
MTNVTKKDLVANIAKQTGLTQVDTKIIVEGFLDSIAKALIEGNNIEIRGFGRFKVRTRKARMARNPRTGEPVKVKEGVKPVFEASRGLQKTINEQIKASLENDDS